MKRVRLAVVGAGHLGRIHARLAAANPRFELVGVVDPIAAACEPLAAELGVAAAADHRMLIGKIDAAVIATPTRLHHAVARDLLLRGVHLLVEKPLAADTREADELVAAAASAGVTLQVGHIERFNPVFSAVAERIRSPKYIEARRYSGFTCRSTDIGVVLDLMIHDVDLVLALTGAKVVEVQALGVAVLGSHEDVASARLVLADGCVANLSASRVSYRPCREMQIWWPEGFAGLDFSKREACLVRPSDAIRLGTISPETLSPDEKKRLQERLFDDILPLELVAPPECNALADELDDFVQAIELRREPRVSGTDGRDAVLVAEMILDAISRHAWNGHPDGPAGATARLPAATLKGPHWPMTAPDATPRRQAG